MARNSSFRAFARRMVSSLMRATSASCCQCACSVASPANFPIPSAPATSHTLNGRLFGQPTSLLLAGKAERQQRRKCLLFLVIVLYDATFAIARIDGHEQDAMQ